MFSPSKWYCAPGPFPHPAFVTCAPAHGHFPYCHMDVCLALTLPSPDLSLEVQTRVLILLCHVSSWMSKSHLKPKMSDTELVTHHLTDPLIPTSSCSGPHIAARLNSSSSLIHICSNGSAVGSTLKALTKSSHHHLLLDWCQGFLSGPPYSSVPLGSSHSSFQDAPTTPTYAEDKIQTPHNVPPALFSIFSALSAVLPSTGILAFDSKGQVMSSQCLRVTSLLPGHSPHFHMVFSLTPFTSLLKSQLRTEGGLQHLMNRASSVYHLLLQNK